MQKLRSSAHLRVQDAKQLKSEATELFSWVFAMSFRTLGCKEAEHKVDPQTEMRGKFWAQRPLKP